MKNSAKCIETVKYKCECNNILLCVSHLKKHIVMPCTDSSHKIAKINSKPSSDEIKILKLSIHKYLNNLLILKQQIILDCTNEIMRIHNNLTSIIKEISEVSKILTEKLSKKKFSLNELSNIKGLENISFDIKPSFIDTGEGFKSLKKFFEHTSNIKKWKELEKYVCGYYDITCWYCNKQSCNEFNRIKNICSECYEKTKCIYCQEFGKNQFNECGHYFCDTHFYPLYFCFCKKCLNCGGDWVIKKSCFHEFECTCESKQICFNCIKIDNEKHLSSDKKNDDNQALNIDTTLDNVIFGNNSSQSVKIIDYNSNINEEKKNKVVVEEKKVSRNQESINEGFFAIKGTDIINKVHNSLKMNQPKSEYCSGCGINEIYKKYECLHSFCKNCFKIGICFICDEGSYCKECYSYHKISPLLLCLHGKCKECIKKQKCTKCSQCSACKTRIVTTTLQGCVHSRCITCQNKPCLLCKSSRCAECGEKEVYKKFKNCSHSFCKKHAKNVCSHCIKCSNCKKPYESENMCGHLFCSSCVKECQNCLCTQCKQNKAIKVYKCGHACCSQCFNNYCQSCFVNCELCCQISEKHSDLSCGHKVCKKCYKSVCYVCKDYLFCKECKATSYSAINFTCVHGLCIYCIKNGKCEKCYCPKSHKSALGTIKDCRHFKCVSCPSTSKNCDECYKIECNVCGTFSSNKKIIEKCGHKACENCFVKNKCYECDENPYCKLCHTKKELWELSNNNYCLNCKSL